MKTIIILSLLFSVRAFSQVTKKQYAQVVSAVEKAYKDLRSDKNALIFVNNAGGMSLDFWWDVTIAQATYVLSIDNDRTTHIITIMGGLARLKEMTPDSLLLMGCHELGHALGKGILKDKPEFGETSNLEGEADYYATKSCLPVALHYLKDYSNKEKSAYISSLCSLQTKHKLKKCERMINAVKGLESMHKSATKQASSIHFNSTQIVEEVNTLQGYYPSAQCRTDTMVNGVLGFPKPPCWFVKN